MVLFPRQLYSDDCDRYRSGYGYNYSSSDCYSSFYSWGRWVVLAVVFLAFIFLFFLLSCLSARRRRRRGLRPYNGTGWLAGKTPPGHAPAQYTGTAPVGGYAPHYGQPQQYSTPPPAPPYGAPPNNSYFGSNASPSPVYPPQPGHVQQQQQTGIELQPPAQTYHQQPDRSSEGPEVYSPPPGAPPYAK